MYNMKKFWKFSKIEERDKTVGYRNDWMSFYPGFKKWNFTIAPASYFDNRFYISFCILWGQFYIHIPFIRSKYDECDPPRYGWYFYSMDRWIPDNFIICYGKKTKFYHMPWELDWVRTSILLKDGTWANETRGNRQDFWKEEWKEKKWKEVHPYMYTLKNGTTQHRMATITVDEREWRPRWFKWTGLFKKIRTTIDVSFDDEVGERSGSWKGGTLGCGYNILPKETPLQCLRRMERERIFN
jgi:hypothetical protein